MATAIQLHKRFTGHLPLGSLVRIHFDQGEPINLVIEDASAALETPTSPLLRGSRSGNSRSPIGAAAGNGNWRVGGFRLKSFVPAGPRSVMRRPAVCRPALTKSVARSSSRRSRTRVAAPERCISISADWGGRSWTSGTARPTERPTEKGRFDSGSLAEGWCEGRPVRFRLRSLW